MIPRDPPGHVATPAARQVEARISARWTVRTPARSRDSPPPMCSRQELSEAEQTSALVEHVVHLVGQHGRRGVGVLDREGPPKPPAGLGLGQLDQVDAADLTQEPQRPVPDPQHPQAVAGQVVGHPVRVVGADVGDPEHVDQELRQLAPRSRGHLAGGRRQLGIAGLLGHPGHAGDAPTRRTSRSGRPAVPSEDLGVPAHRRHRLGEVAGGDVHLPAAGLGPRHLDRAPQSLQQPHCRLADIREQPVHQTGHEQGDTHARPSTMPVRPLPRRYRPDALRHPLTRRRPPASRRPADRSGRPRWPASAGPGPSRPPRRSAPVPGARPPRSAPARSPIEPLVEPGDPGPVRQRPQLVPLLDDLVGLGHHQRGRPRPAGPPGRHLDIHRPAAPAPSHHHPSAPPPHAPPPPRPLGRHMHAPEGVLQSCSSNRPRTPRRPVAAPPRAPEGQSGSGGPPHPGHARAVLVSRRRGPVRTRTRVVSWSQRQNSEAKGVAGARTAAMR